MVCQKEPEYMSENKENTVPVQGQREETQQFTDQTAENPPSDISAKAGPAKIDADTEGAPVVKSEPEPADGILEKTEPVKNGMDPDVLAPCGDGESSSPAPASGTENDTETSENSPEGNPEQGIPHAETEINPAIYGLAPTDTLSMEKQTSPEANDTNPLAPPVEEYPGRPCFGSSDFYKTSTIFLPKTEPHYSIEELAEWMRSKDVQFGLNYTFGGDRRYITAESSDKIWFVSDLHGDHYSLQKIMTLIDQNDPDAVIVFMGDLFDRSTKNLETVKAVLELIKNRPGKIVWLLGNHDGDLMYSEELKQFSSAKIEHGDGKFPFFDDLNKLKETSPAYEDFGKALIAFIAKLPHTILFSDGIIVSHAGIPLLDTLENIKTIEDLNSDSVRYDCCWARPEDKDPKPSSNPENDKTSVTYYKLQRINPDPSGPPLFGTCWTAFAEKMSAIAKLRPYCLLIGHTPQSKGYLMYRKYPCIILDSNRKALSGIGFGPFQIAFARGRKAGCPEVFVLQMDKKEYDDFYTVSAVEVSAEE